MTNQGAIFIADFAGKCIREKVMMTEPIWTDKKNLEEYQSRLANRRTYPYPVSKEQDGKELREGIDFEIDSNGENYEWAFPKGYKIGAINNIFEENERLLLLIEFVKKAHLRLYHKPVAGYKLPEILNQEVEAGWKLFKTRFRLLPYKENQSNSAIPIEPDTHLKDEIKEWILEVMNRGIIIPSDSLYQKAIINFVNVKNGIYVWNE